MTRTIICLCLSILSFSIFAQFDCSIDFVSGVDQSGSNRGLIGSTTNYNQRIGANFNVKLFDNVILKTGLRYAQVGVKNDHTVISTINWRYIEVPLILRYQIGKKAISGFMEFGVSPHIYINTLKRYTSNNRYELEVEDESPFGVKKFRSAIVYSIGVNYDVRKKVQLFLQLVTRKYDALHNQPASSARLRNIGFEFGFRRGFNFERTK